MIKLTREQAQEEFDQEIRPYVIDRYGENDEVALRTAWIDYTDGLHKDGRISDEQVNNW